MLLFTLVSTVDPEEILTRERAMGEQGNRRIYYGSFEIWQPSVLTGLKTLIKTKT